jgi:CxxC motif-containing protein
VRRKLTCIVCPGGCAVEAYTDDRGRLVISGAKCKRGKDYAYQEIVDPRRTIATSMVITGGELPLCSVRLSKPIPKKRIFDVMDAIRAKNLCAPVQIGDVAIADVCGTGSDVIVTKSIPMMK